MPRITVATHKKPAFTLDEARAIAAACGQMERPLVNDMTSGKWWRAFVALHFYTGLRNGTIYQLRWRHLVEENGLFYLEVPASLVTKTGKGIRIAVHPQLAAALKIKYHKSADHLILPGPAGRIEGTALNRRTIMDWHKDLQRLAGLKGAQVMSIHAWRRTHGQLLAELGLGQAEELARVALDHSHKAVTLGSYVSVVDAFRLRLPDLWPGGAILDSQRRLW
jgi:integrase